MMMNKLTAIGGKEERGLVEKARWLLRAVHLLPLLLASEIKSETHH